MAQFQFGVKDTNIPWYMSAAPREPQARVDLGNDPAIWKSQQLMQMLSGLGSPQPQGPMVLGPVGQSGMVAAPQLQAPNFGAADAAYAQAKPKPIAAPEYVMPNYTQADEYWNKGAPPQYDEDDYTNAKWGSILQGAIQGLMSGGNNGLLRAALGGLGGYGESLGVRSKMKTEDAKAMADYSVRRAGYEGDKSQTLSNTKNNQLQTNFQADRYNQSSIEDYYKALGGYESGKAKEITDVGNTNATLNFRARLHNAEAGASRGFKIIGTFQGNAIVQGVDKNGNLTVELKPLAGARDVNGRMGGTLSRGNPGASGLASIIDTLRANGVLESVIGEDEGYANMMKQIGADDSTYAGLTNLGEEGRKEAFARNRADEDAWLAQYFATRPDKLEAAMNLLMGGQNALPGPRPLR